MRLIGLVLTLLTLSPLVTQAQQVGKVHRVGLIATTSPVSEMAGPEPIHPSIRAFVHGLRALGYVEGQNLILERRSPEGRFERFGDIVAELVRLRTDVIVAPGDVAPLAAKTVTTTVPIVMATAEDPVGAGLVQSLARPGGSVTGLTLVVGTEIEGKRLEIFREARVEILKHLDDALTIMPRPSLAGERRAEISGRVKSDSLLSAQEAVCLQWLRGSDLNRRPVGYESKGT